MARAWIEPHLRYPDQWRPGWGETQMLKGWLGRLGYDVEERIVGFDHIELRLERYKPAPA